jgi:hypothetical protein
MKTRIPKRLTTIDIIQQEINTISTWLYVNKLSINITKTKFILFKTKKKKSNHKIEISINNQNIEQVNQTTFLGVIIDENLTWNSHLNLIYKKIMKSTVYSDYISKIRHFTNLNSRKLLYYSLVYP